MVLDGIFHKTEGRCLLGSTKLKKKKVKDSPFSRVQINTGGLFNNGMKSFVYTSTNFFFIVVFLFISKCWLWTQ